MTERGGIGMKETRRKLQYSAQFEVDQNEYADLLMTCQRQKLRQSPKPKLNMFRTMSAHLRESGQKRTRNC